MSTSAHARQRCALEQGLQQQPFESAGPHPIGPDSMKLTQSKTDYNKSNSACFVALLAACSLTQCMGSKLNGERGLLQAGVDRLEESFTVETSDWDPDRSPAECTSIMAGCLGVSTICTTHRVRPCVTPSCQNAPSTQIDSMTNMCIARSAHTQPVQTVVIRAVCPTQNAAMFS